MANVEQARQQAALERLVLRIDDSPQRRGKLCENERGGQASRAEPQIPAEHIRLAPAEAASLVAQKPARNSGGGAQLQLLDGPLRMQIQLRRPLSQVAAKHIQTVIVRRRNRPGRLDRNLFLVHSTSFATHSLFQYRRLGWLNRKRATGSFAGSCRLPTLSAFSSGSPKTGQSATIRGLHRQIPRSPEIERPPPSLPTPIRLARDSHEPS